MDEVLQQLIKKTKTDCEESHRQYVAASNGLAALAIIRYGLRGVASAVRRRQQRSRRTGHHQVRTARSRTGSTSPPATVSPHWPSSGTDCEESHRQYVAASNGLAALAIIRYSCNVIVRTGDNSYVLVHVAVVKIT